MYAQMPTSRENPNVTGPSLRRDGVPGELNSPLLEVDWGSSFTAGHALTSEFIFRFVGSECPDIQMRLVGAKFKDRHWQPHLTSLSSISWSALQPLVFEDDDGRELPNGTYRIEVVGNFPTSTEGRSQFFRTVLTIPLNASDPKTKRTVEIRAGEGALVNLVGNSADHVIIHADGHSLVNLDGMDAQLDTQLAEELWESQQRRDDTTLIVMSSLPSAPSWWLERRRPKNESQSPTGVAGRTSAASPMTSHPVSTPVTSSVSKPVAQPVPQAKAPAASNSKNKSNLTDVVAIVRSLKDGRFLGIATGQDHRKFMTSPGVVESVRQEIKLGDVALEIGEAPPSRLICEAPDRQTGRPTELKMGFLYTRSHRFKPPIIRLAEPGDNQGDLYSVYRELPLAEDCDRDQLRLRKVDRGPNLNPSGDAASVFEVVGEMRPACLDGAPVMNPKGRIVGMIVFEDHSPCVVLFPAEMLSGRRP